MNSSHSSSSGPSPSPSRRSTCPTNNESSSVQLDPSRTLLWSASLLYYTGLPSLKIKRSHLRPAVSMSDMDGANVSFKGSLSKSPSTDSGTGTVSSVGTKGSSSTLGRLSFSPFRKRHSSSGSASTNSIESSGSLREKLEKTESMKGIGMRPKKRSSLASFISRTGSLGRYKKHDFASDWTKSPLHIETEQKETDEAVGAFGPSPESPCLTPSPVSTAPGLSVSTSKAFRESLRVAKCLLPSSSSSKIALSSHFSSSKAGQSTEDKLKSSDTVQAELTEPLSTSVSCSNITKPTNQFDCGHKYTKKTKKFFLNSSACSECEISKHLNLLQNFDKEESLVGFSPAGSSTVIERPVGQQHQKEEKDNADANNKSKKRKDKESKDSSHKKVSIVKSLGRRMLRGSSKEIKDVSSQIESEYITSNKAANSIDPSSNISVSLSDCKMPLELVQYDSEPRKLTPKPIPRLFGQEIKVEERNVINHNEINAMEVNNTCIEKVETSPAGILQEESLTVQKSQIKQMEKPKPKLYSKVLMEQNNDKDEANDTKSEETASEDTKVSTVEVSTIENELNPIQIQDSPESKLGEEPPVAEDTTESSSKIPENDSTDSSGEIAENDSTTEISKLNVQNNTETAVQSHKSLTLLQEPELNFYENIQVTVNSLDEKEKCSYTEVDNGVSTDSLLLKEANKNDVDVSLVQSGNPVDSSTISTKSETDEEKEGSFTESFKHLEPFSYDIEPVEEGKRERLYKVLVVGELGTGKTSIIKRYVHQFFSQHYRATIGVDFALKVLRWDPETVVRLQLWDIAGQERFGSMTRVYYKEAVGAFVVFDVTRAATLEAVPKWKADLDTKVVLPDGRPIPTVLLANKSDQPKEGIAANREKMNDFCQQQGFSAWFETSAKDNINIDESANFLVSKILEMDRWSQEPLAPDPEKLDLSANGKHKAGGSSSCAC